MGRRAPNPARHFEPTVRIHRLDTEEHFDHSHGHQDPAPRRGCGLRFLRSDLRRGGARIGDHQFDLLDASDPSLTRRRTAVGSVTKR
jgi:hypothetical protein